MAQRVKALYSEPISLLQMVAGAAGVKKGQILVFNAGVADAASEGVATAIVLGVSAEDADAGEIVPIYPASKIKMQFPIYQGGATDVFADADVGDLFDIYVDANDTYLDPNDKVGGFVILESYDNLHQLAVGRIPQTLCYA